MNENNQNHEPGNQSPQENYKYYSEKNPYEHSRVTTNSRADKGFKIFLITLISVFTMLIVLFGIFATASTIKKSTNFNGIARNFIPEIPNITEDKDTKDDPLKSTFHDPNGSSLKIEDTPKDVSELSAEKIFADVSPSIVCINEKKDITSPESESSPRGSGVIMSEDGYIITNHHVLSNNITVVTSDGKEYNTDIVGYDRRNDLAVIKINATGLKPASFGNSDQLSVGSWVLSIGNPGGMDFSNSLTRGIVSAINRTVSSANTITKYIQTDAAINPGSSGGALLNMYGQVVGINSSKLVSTSIEGMCFAIPTTSVKPIVDDLIKQGYVSDRVKLGIIGKEISKSQAESNAIPQGIIITEISEQSDLTNKNVRVGDIITKVNGKEITSFGYLYSELQNYRVGDVVTLTIYQPPKDRISNGTYVDIDITLLSDKG